MKSSRFVSIALGVVILTSLGPTNSLCAASPIETIKRDLSGVTLYSDSGALRIDICSASVIHVIASPPARFRERLYLQ